MLPISNDQHLLVAADRLVESIRKHTSVLIAFSGGVDSAVVAQAAYLALGDRAIAATGLGAAVSERDRIDATQVASQIGIRHLWLPTLEIEDPKYRINDGRRCYHCKSHLYIQLNQWARTNGIQSILSGTNLDDLGDYRPGLEAANENRIVAPLAELGFGKEMVRSLAQHWKLRIATKPASPCLASRIAYGVEVNPERLRMIERAESFLRTLPISDVRVRWYPDSVAVIELPKEEMMLLEDVVLFQVVIDQLRSFGFDSVKLEKDGLQSGRLNRLLPILQ